MNLCTTCWLCGGSIPLAHPRLHQIAPCEACIAKLRAVMHTDKGPGSLPPAPVPASGEWTEALAQKDEWIDRLRDAVKDAVESVERTSAQCCGTSMLHTVQVSSTQVALWRAALRVEGEVRT